MTMNSGVENDEIKFLLHKILERLNDLETRIKKVENSTNNMDEHISFVEEIYTSIKKPFHSFIDYVSTYQYPMIDGGVVEDKNNDE